MSKASRNRPVNPRTLRPLDAVVIALVLAAAILSGIAVYGGRGEPSRLVIESPEGSWVYGLDTDRTVQIPGKLGNTVVEITGGKARITASPCPNQTCVAAPAVSRKGDWNACLPNEVIVRVEGSGAEGFDAIAK
jgi:hypothetical protein